MSYVYLWMLTIPLVILMDLLWLGVLAKDLYQTRLAHLLGPIVWTPAFIFYCVYAAGVIFFAVHPALQASSLGKAAFLGGILGFLTYATYDLTNHATLKSWPLLITIVDILWGAFLTGTVASLSFLIAKHLGII